MVNIQVKVRCGCNYKCWYCVAKHQIEKTEEFNLDQMEVFLNDLSDKDASFSFECGASEPALHPQIKDLIKLLLKYGEVSIPTNNSIDPDLWLPEGDCGRLKLRCALHPENEKTIDDFVLRMLHIKSKGARVSCIFCASPDRLYKIKEYSKFFEEKQIPFTVIPLVGEFGGKVYPQAYTQEDQKLIFGIKREEDRDWYQKIKPLIPTRDFYDIPCFAGFSLFYIDSKEIFKCLYDRKPLEKPFKGATPCRVHDCGCGFFLEEFSKDDIKICPSEDFEEEFEKIVKRYFDLMKKYGKLDDAGLKI